MARSVKYIIVILIGIVLGIIADRNKDHLINAQFIRDHWSFRKVIDNSDEIIKSDQVMVMFTLGQSNSANYGNGKYSCKNEVYNYYKGDLYKAEEPLLGPDGSGCSVWTRVADMLIDSGIYKKVVIVPIGIGSTSVECWSDGPCSEKLKKTLADLKDDKIELSHILWDQGETDNVDGTTKLEYKTRLKKVIKIFRDQQFNAPFLISISGYFPYANTNPFGIDLDITTAQSELIAENYGKQGPNTDSLNLAYYRADAVHFTEKGLDVLAYEWFKKIKATRK